jgi:hypothetical protein
LARDTLILIGKPKLQRVVMNVHPQLGEEMEIALYLMPH